MAPAYGPWHPGIVSPIPAPLRPLATILRPQNVFTDYGAARELHDLTGLPLAELVTFRPERLALHELLVRVTADISVPDGPRIGDLGVNFRGIVGTILSRYVAPRSGVLSDAYDAVKREIARIVEGEVDSFFSGSDALARWRSSAAGDGAAGASYGALAKLGGALLARHGRPWGTRELLGDIAIGMACNDAGSDAIGRALEPMIAEAARREGYRLLPPQERPVVMNTKGPSASGKSSLRPLQRKLAGDLGIEWREFSYVSPDIWRKQLLDYESLGTAYKYAGSFTAEEVAIVDLKLDRYMARKGAAGRMSHLLIDRFRFDSFAPNSDEAGSNLLTRFGQIVYLFFMITPPGSLVERAWARGLEFGRYKPVDDTLAHAVEAYTGMPELFFTWVSRGDKRVHFEFLDNSVALGERPRTVAFGWNDVLNVLDVKGMLDVERFRRVNIAAASPAELWARDAALAGGENAGFLRQCIARFKEVNFADRATGGIYLRLASGSPVWSDGAALAQATAHSDIRDALVAAVPAAFASDLPQSSAWLLGAERIHTLGSWGAVASADARQP